jgi:predicted aspartyl protease
MTVRGSKAAVELKNVLIDTGATYTVLPEEILEEVGAWGPMPEVEVALGVGKKSKLKLMGWRSKLKRSKPLR